jgi:hypothetical protein
VRPAAATPWRVGGLARLYHPSSFAPGPARLSRRRRAPRLRARQLVHALPWSADEGCERRDLFSGHVYPPTESWARLFAEQLYQGLPQVTLAQRLRMSPAERATRLFPYTQRDALLQFLLGGIALRPVDIRRPHDKAAAERR